MPKQILGQEYYTVSEAAELLGVSRMTVLRWATDDKHPMHSKIRAFKHSRTNRCYLDMKAIDRLAEKESLVRIA